MGDIECRPHNHRFNHRWTYASPCGRAIAEAMENELLQAIQHHLNKERQAHVAYFAAAIWCAERIELRGFASYFSEESKNEHIHAEKFSRIPYF